MTDAPPEIRVQNAGFSYGRRSVLRDVSLELRPGRHVVVVGPNGAGKSTLLDLLANLKRPETGRVDIAGRPAGQYRPGELARILALAPQEFRLDFSFSVREIVGMGRRPHLGRWGRLGAVDRRAVEQALADMHLVPLAEKSVMALSGGEKRRCVVARALAQETPVLLLDEPSSGLDVAQALSVMALARRRAEDGALVVTVTHDLNLAARYGHDLVFLRDGGLAARGPVADAFTDAVLSRVFDADARVFRDAHADAPAVSFRPKGDPRSPEKESDPP